MKTKKSKKVGPTGPTTTPPPAGGSRPSGPPPGGPPTGTPPGAPPTGAPPPPTAPPPPAPTAPPTTPTPPPTIPWRQIIVAGTIILAIIMVGLIWLPQLTRETPPAVPPAPSFWDNVYAQKYLGPTGISMEVTEQKVAYQENGLVTARGEVRTDTLMSVMIQLAKSRTVQKEKERRVESFRRGVLVNTLAEEVKVEGLPNSSPLTLGPGESKFLDLPIGGILLQFATTNKRWLHETKIPQGGNFSFGGESGLDFLMKVH